MGSRETYSLSRQVILGWTIVNHPWRSIIWSSAPPDGRLVWRYSNESLFMNGIRTQTVNTPEQLSIVSVHVGVSTRAVLGNTLNVISNAFGNPHISFIKYVSMVAY